MLNLEDFIDMNVSDIIKYFNDFSKDEILGFCKNNNIPYKSYYSKKKILVEVVDFVNSTMIFKRISNH